jgi:hypothetical protein
MILEISFHNSDSKWFFKYIDRIMHYKAIPDYPWMKSDHTDFAEIAKVFYGYSQVENIVLRHDDEL